MNKIMAMDDAIKMIKDGDVLLVGGFGPRGYPGRILRALLKKSAAKDFTIIINGLNKFYLNTMEKILKSRANRLICTYVRNSEGERMFNEGKAEIVPQGTFAERLRCGGAGIPAFYTPVGVGTDVAKGKEVKNIDGRDYLMEKALKGDVALISATKVDKSGNCFMRGCTKQFSTLMPAAAKYTIVETHQIVEVGEIDPELISVPGIMVDAIVYVG